MPIPFAALAPFGAALVSGASQLFTNRSNAREARRNREFQQRNADTAHRREVLDLQAAGLNPALSVNRGAPVPGGDRAQFEDPGGKGIASALQVKLAQAQIRDVEASAELKRAQVGDLTSQAAAGRYSIISAQRDIAELDLDQRRQLVPLILQRARQEIDMMASSARASQARSALDEAAAAGAENLEAFERQIGEAGPWVKVFFNLLRSLRR